MPIIFKESHIETSLVVLESRKVKGKTLSVFGGGGGILLYKWVFRNILKLHETYAPIWKWAEFLIKSTFLYELRTSLIILDLQYKENEMSMKLIGLFNKLLYNLNVYKSLL